MKIVITENQLSFLVSEQMQMTKIQQPSDYLGKGGEFEKMNSIQDPFKIPLKKGPKENTTLDEAMENFRQNLFSPTGIAIETFLTSFGWTAPAVMGAYGGLLSYDIYKSLNGKTDWGNIVFDTLALVTSGLLSGVIAPFIRGGKKSFDSIKSVFSWLKTTNIWTKLKPYLSKIGTLLSTIGGWLSKGIKWIADNTGLTFLLKWSGKILSFFNNISKTMLNSLEEGVSDVVRGITKNEKVVQAAGKSSKIGAGNVAFNTGIDLLPGDLPKNN